MIAEQAKQIKELRTIKLNGWLKIAKSIKKEKRIKFLVKILDPCSS